RFQVRVAAEEVVRPAGANGKKLQGDLETLRGEIAAAERKQQAVENDPQLRAMAEAHSHIAAAAREETARLHAGDLENQRLWEEFLPVCLDALEKVYQRLGIEFDLTLGESYYHPLLNGVVDDLASRGLARESAGAMCVFHEGHEAPFIIRKSDGAFTYATTDLATIRYRIDDLKADAIVYVVDARQSEHFQLLFATARKWGYEQTELRHVSFGTVLGDDRRPFKTRVGDTIGLESLLNEAVARARTIVDENDDAKRDAAGNSAPELDETERARVAEVVGIGGIKYADLRHNRESDYVFSWDKMLAKTGDTATYIQYSFARACGILRKGEVDRSALRQRGQAIRLEMPSERSLALLLCRFVEAVEDVVVDWRPNVLAQYLFETANQFNLFYDHCPTPIIREPDEALRTSRYRLCDLTARVLQRGLGLLGIETAERM
ncbi:MAG: arginine--tRNA ligase, partial [Planctomycetes bacterium]|nr:arginine--tRNA ligase [Planctomycetota bacterium]